MAPSDTDEVKKLTPEERIEKLKKIKKLREQEIKEAEKLLHEAEDEIKDTRTFEEKVPIPQVATRDTSNLSEEGKLIVAMQRGEDGSKKETINDSKTNENTNKKFKKSEASLEETLGGVHIPTGQMHLKSGFDRLTSAYITELAQVPMQNLYTEMVEVYGAVKEKGYLSTIEQERISNLTSAIEQKVQDANAGDYSMSKEVARAVSVSQQISNNLNILYHGNKKEKKDQSNWYDKN